MTHLGPVSVLDFNHRDILEHERTRRCQRQATDQNNGVVNVVGGGRLALLCWPTPPTVMCVRRCPTLPHPPGCSTIGAVSLSFRVRNGTGRFPHAITTVTCDPTPTLGVGNLWSGDLSAIIGCPLTHRLLAGVGVLVL